MTDTLMAEYTVLDPDSGAIIKCGACLVSDMQLQCEPGQIVVRGSYLPDDYMFDGEMKRRPNIPYRTSRKAGSTIFRMPDVPAGTHISVIGPAGREAFTVEDGSFAYASDYAGAYAFIVKPPFPWRLRVVEVEVE